MLLDKLRIQNFRGLEDISLEGMKTASAITIAGPNQGKRKKNERIK